MAKKSAIFGEYIITIEDSGKVRILKIYDNVKGSLCECAEAKEIKKAETDEEIEAANEGKDGFKYYNKDWTTRQFGSRLIKAFGEGNQAEIGEYTIVKRDCGSIETYRTYGKGKTMEILSEIAGLVNAAMEKAKKAERFEIDKSTNTQQNGSKLVDFINANK